VNSFNFESIEKMTKRIIEKEEREIKDIIVCKKEVIQICENLV